MFGIVDAIDWMNPVSVSVRANFLDGSSLPDASYCAAMARVDLVRVRFLDPAATCPSGAVDDVGVAVGSSDCSAAALLVIASSVPALAVSSDESRSHQRSMAWTNACLDLHHIVSPPSTAQD